MAKRRDTKIEAEGAEFLVCAHLLIEGIVTYKTYTQMPGYDLISTDPELGTSCRIQVKSRWATDSSGGFMLKNADADFVAHVLLNRGTTKRKINQGPTRPEIFIYPIEVALAARRDDGWGKVMVNKIPAREEYKENWGLIRRYLTERSGNDS